MRKTDEQIEKSKRERFEAMAVRLSQHLKLSNADTFEKLPAPIKDYLNGLRYCDLVKPLIKDDHYNGATLRQMCIRYGLSKTAIENHVKN